MFSLHIPTDTQIMTMCGDEYVNGLDCGNHFTMYMYIKTTNCTPFSSVQLLNCAQFFRIPWSEARQASLTITNSQSLLKLMSNELVMPSNDLILCRPHFLLPSIFPSIMVFSNESVLHIRWPKYWSFSFSIIPSNEYSGLISFRMDWLDLLAVQGTLNTNTTVQKHQFFSTQPSLWSNSYIHTWLLEKS